MQTRQPIFLLTTSSHKIREFQILAGSAVSIKSAFDAFPHIKPALEDGASFQENAIKKLSPVDELQSDACFIAEDSGLCCLGLDGAPGIYSARFGGDGADDEDRRRKLLSLLGKNRVAFYITSMAVKGMDGSFSLYEGRVYGRIAIAERGHGGFGYDPLFIPDGYTETFGELAPAIKARISHRARACRAFFTI